MYIQIVNSVSHTRKFRRNVIILCDQDLMKNCAILGLFVYVTYLMMSLYERVLLILIIFVDGCLSFVY